MACTASATLAAAKPVPTTDAAGPARPTRHGLRNTQYAKQVNSASWPLPAGWPVQDGAAGLSNVQPGVMRMLTYPGGDAALPVIERYLERVRQNLTHSLTPFEPVPHFDALLDVLRGIEELVNAVFTEIPDLEDAETFAGLLLRYQDAGPLLSAKRILDRYFEAPVVSRILHAIAQLQDYAATSAARGGPPVAERTRTVGEAAVYLQGRRRLLVAQLYAIPTACAGTERANRLHGMTPFMTRVDQQWQFAVNMHRERLLAQVFPDYVLTDHDQLVTSNQSYQPLDTLALEPERLSILDIHETQASIGPLPRESLPAGHIFSVEEVRNQLAHMKAAFIEFDLAGGAFTPLMAVLSWSLAFCTDGYRVQLPLSVLLERLQALPDAPLARRRLLYEGGELFESVNVFCPFIRVGDQAVSCLPLMTRFMNYFRNTLLNRNRRYQIRSGFIFEAAVKECLKAFSIHCEPTKRIENKEFDVIARYGDVLINIQCKNNEVDLTRMESSSKWLARHFIRLNAYYQRALTKEHGREHLLRAKFKPMRIAHLVLTKSATPNNNPRVLSYAEIDQLPARAIAYSA